MTSSDIRRDGHLGREGKKEGGDMFEKEVEVVQAQQPLSVQDMEIGAREGGNDGGDGEDNASGLPFSKARCIALVATVTGAAFLNVSFWNVCLSRFRWA